MEEVQSLIINFIERKLITL